MSKNFCKIENKWCKFCKKGCFCNYTSRFNNFISLNKIRKCPVRINRETLSFRELLLSVSFEDIMASMIKYWPKEKNNLEGYKNVYINLLNIKGKKSDYFINVEYEYFDEWTEDGMSKTGKQSYSPSSSAIYFSSLNKKNKINYSIDSFPWKEVVTMNITKSSLENIPWADIISSTLYELTFYGFTEEKVSNFFENLQNTYNEMSGKNTKFNKENFKVGILKTN